MRVVILSLGWDFNPNSTAGKFLIRQLALVSELLLDLTRDATIEALDGDVIEGKRHSIYGAKLGRPGVTLSPDALSAARQQRADGVPMSEIVRTFPPGRRRYKAADGSWQEMEHPVSAGMLWRALRDA